MKPVNYISGHLSLTDEEFALHYQPSIDAALSRGESLVVGDARGADTMAQNYLLNKTESVDQVMIPIRSLPFLIGNGPLPFSTVLCKPSKRIINRPARVIDFPYSASIK